MTNPTVTVFAIGYEEFIIDPKDASTLLALFAKAERVQSRYVGGEVGSVWVRKADRGDRIRISQDSGAVLNPSDFELVKAAEEKRQADADAANEAEAEAA